MLAAGADRTMPEGATALEIPSDRPAFLTSPSYGGGPPAATAVFLPRETLTGPPATIRVYFNFALDPELEHYWRRLAYAYITPSEAPCRADPGPFIRRVFRTLALDLPQTFELLPPEHGAEHGADMALRFRTPDFREAALLRQPFVLDGVTVKLLRDGETPDTTWDVVSTDYLVHAALRDYPIRIGWNCCRFGYVREIDPACFAAPDLATVRVVLQIDHPREIPHELRIDYEDADGSASVVPVEIVSVWHHSHSYDANGQYVPLFQSLVAAA